MHITHPSLSTIGKRKGKKKFRNADEARRARELEESWKELEKKWASTSKSETKKRSEKLEYSLSTPTDRSTKHIKSVGAGVGVATLAPAKVYSGDKVLGVTVIHKSCLQPVFNQQAAVDAAKMRR
jgi:hypothetical protein